MLIVSFQTPEPDLRCELTFLSDLGHGAILYGLYYPGFGNCVGWCYLTIAPGVIIATHTETNGHPSDSGTSITNMWSVKFLATLMGLAPIQAAGKVRWFEHYHRPDEATLDEVLITARGLPGNSGDVAWKHIAYGTGVSVANAWEALTGVLIPDFAATGFESYNEALTFVLDSKRGSRESLTQFAIDLQKLAEGDLQKLNAFLLRQHSGVRDDYTFVRSLVWLFTTSLQQSGVAVDQIDARVRELLLC